MAPVLSWTTPWPLDPNICMSPPWWGLVGWPILAVDGLELFICLRFIILAMRVKGVNAENVIVTLTVTYKSIHNTWKHFLYIF